MTPNAHVSVRVAGAKPGSSVYVVAPNTADVNARVKIGGVARTHFVAPLGVSNRRGYASQLVRVEATNEFDQRETVYASYLLGTPHACAVLRRAR
jgi:hypothetical protein